MSVRSASGADEATSVSKCPEWCYVPRDVVHEHRPPTEADLADSYYDLKVKHPSHCSWRKDIYDGCDCGVTAAVTALEDLMRERT